MTVVAKKIVVRDFGLFGPDSEISFMTLEEQSFQENPTITIAISAHYCHPHGHHRQRARLFLASLRNVCFVVE